MSNEYIKTDTHTHPHIHTHMHTHSQTHTNTHYAAYCQFYPLFTFKSAATSPQPSLLFKVRLAPHPSLHRANGFQENESRADGVLGVRFSFFRHFLTPDRFRQTDGCGGKVANTNNNEPD